MSEPVDWGADGTPRSPRFDDIYRSASGGIQQARHVFLGGCGLPQAWAGQPQWRILETGFGLGLNFLVCWHAWREDPQRPRLLHFVSVEAFPVAAEDLLRSAAAAPELQPLAEELASRWWGLLPGFHRLSFDDGHVLLTLCVGDVQPMLREQAFHADSVFLDGFSPERNPAMWQLPTLKAIARLCRRGAAIATWTVAGEVRRHLQQCGFRPEKTDGLPPKRQCLRGVFDPHWDLARAAEAPAASAARCVVIGAGLAGAAAAASFARRGWEVTVLDAAGAPAQGASGLPAGLLAPHQSPDDNLLSRLSRAGVRITMQEAQRLLPRDDWDPCGVLENRLDDARPLPALGDQLHPFSRPASGRRQALAGLPPQSPAWWHEKAAWIRPAALVRAWLQHPAITRRSHARVRRLQFDAGFWRVLGDDDTELARADWVIVAAAHDSAALLPVALNLNPVRGQVSWSHEVPDTLPFAVNGNGHFLPRVPLPGGPAWLTGSTYGRGDTLRDERTEDHAANLERLRVLLPETARALAPQFDSGLVQAWSGIRCASADRRPLVGLVAPGLAVSTAMGSRGLTFAALGAELLAARLHREPLPLERKLAVALDVARQLHSL